MAPHLSSSCTQNTSPVLIRLVPATRMSGETFFLLYNMKNTRTAKKLKTRSTLHASLADACTNLSSHLSLLCVESKIKLKITIKAIRPYTQSEIHTERSEDALTCSEVTQRPLAFHFSLRWRTGPCPLQFLYLQGLLQRSCGILHMRLPQRLPHCGSAHNMSLTTPIVVHFSICLWVPQHPESHCLRIVARLPNVDRLATHL